MSMPVTRCLNSARSPAILPWPQPKYDAAGNTIRMPQSLDPPRSFTAVYDACVLYPAPLRDLLMRLALTDLFRAKWTEAIHDEWIRSVPRERPDLSAEQLQRTRTLISILETCAVALWSAAFPRVKRLR